MPQSIIPAPPGKASNFENPQDALHTVNLVTQILCIAVTTVIVTLRFIVRIRIHKTFTLEDYATSIAYVIFMGFCACMLVLNRHGGGYHAWEVPMENYISFQKASYATTVIYVPMVFTVKLALLSVMLRIFAPDKTKVLVIWVSLGLMLTYYVIALFLKVFFCHPISTYWTGSGGSCMDQQKVIIADSAISIISDLWILILPVPMLWSLNMPRVKKLRVIGMLGAGGLATAFSIWRLVIMVEEGKTTDVTFFWIRAVLTANAEGDIGLICACLPTLSSFIASVRNKSNSGSNASYLRSHEMDHWQKISASKKSRRDSFSFPTTQNDQAHLISTAAGVSDGHDDHDGSWSTLPTQGKNGNGNGNGNGDQAVIQKDVTVSQSYEFVK